MEKTLCFCDRCGAQITDEYGEIRRKGRQHRFFIRNLWRNNGLERGKDIDLCKQCFAELERWMNDAAH